ncbi:MAG TPA: hypothetical protein PKD80_10185 [Microthrixaceae bacterium]|nr:hypothetical protein [Microthrixaceae bacterium]HMT24756.1 hypothetical protein [Microthrixaceae bacterium]HMT59771.1 hypothetical protein [Microthrixaceae bacterium]
MRAQRVAALLVVGATSCGLVPGTSEAGKAGVPEYEPTRVPVAGGGFAPKKSSPTLAPGSTIFPSFAATTTTAPAASGPAQPVEITTTTAVQRWTLDEMLLRRCNAMVDFFTAGQQIELLLQHPFAPAEYDARLQEAKATLPKLFAELPENAVSAINATVKQIELPAAEQGSESQIRTALYRRISANADTINVMFEVLFPLCPDLMGDEPPRFAPTGGKRAASK